MNREVISISTGQRLGTIDDLVMDTEGCVTESFIIRGRPHLMGLMGKDEDVVIPCSDIERIGADTVLVRTDDNDLFRMHKNEI